MLRVPRRAEPGKRPKLLFTNHSKNSVGERAYNAPIQIVAGMIAIKVATPSTATYLRVRHARKQGRTSAVRVSQPGPSRPLERNAHAPPMPNATPARRVDRR